MVSASTTGDSLPTVYVSDSLTLQMFAIVIVNISEWIMSYYHISFEKRYLLQKLGEERQL